MKNQEKKNKIKKPKRDLFKPREFNQRDVVDELKYNIYESYVKDPKG